MMEPAEAAALLDKPSIQFDDGSDPTDLGTALAPRLEALLTVYDLKPDAEGWRTLALRLAAAHVAALRLQEPIRGGKGGRPSIVSHAVLYSRLRRLRDRMGQGGLLPSNIDVARVYLATHRKHRGGPALPSLKVMQTVLTEGDAGRLAGNPLFAFLTLDPIREAAMEQAASIVESRN